MTGRLRSTADSFVGILDKMRSSGAVAALALSASLCMACGSDDDGGGSSAGGTSNGGGGGTSGTGAAAGSGGVAGGGGSGGGTCVDDPKAPAPSVSVAPVTGLALPKDRADLMATATSPNGANRSPGPPAQSSTTRVLRRPSRWASVDLPGAGSISVKCRAGGSFYHVTQSGGAATATLVDEDALRPTKLLAP